MYSNKEIISRVIERYDISEIAELLDVEYILDDADDLDIEGFTQLFRTKILENKEDLDIW